VFAQNFDVLAGDDTLHESSPPEVHVVETEYFVESHGGVHKVQTHVVVPHVTHELILVLHHFTGEFVDGVDVQTLLHGFEWAVHEQPQLGLAGVGERDVVHAQHKLASALVVVKPQSLLSLVFGLVVLIK